MQLTTEQFVEKAKLVHGNKYDYSKVVYDKTFLPIEIVCPKHGSFKQTPNAHLRGLGCKFCGYSNRAKLNSFSIKAKYVDSNKLQSDLDKVCKNQYTVVDGTYKSHKEQVQLVCKDHGVFYTTPRSIIRGYACSLCYNEWKRLLSEKTFINQSNEVHKNFYNYNKVHYTRPHDKVVIVCPVHGEFYQSASSHVRGTGCPSCNASKGELKIKNWLDLKNKSYIQQYKLDDCRDTSCLPFDFAIFENQEKTKLKCLIEFDGKQHFEVVDRFGGQKGFEVMRRHDELKTKYCEDNKISLIRIHFKSFNKLEEILDKQLGT